MSKKRCLESTWYWSLWLKLSWSCLINLPICICRYSLNKFLKFIFFKPLPCSWEFYNNFFNNIKGLNPRFGRSLPRPALSSSKWRRSLLWTDSHPSSNAMSHKKIRPQGSDFFLSFFGWGGMGDMPCMAYRVIRTLVRILNNTKLVEHSGLTIKWDKWGT
jgi:hypothetical protein